MMVSMEHLPIWINVKMTIRGQLVPEMNISIPRKQNPDDEK
tara:strand:+ start:203 stop:325 length:123 start_codon:yes stop_codon:yes gene_type:complete